MKNRPFTIFPLAPAHLVGVGALQISIILLFFFPEFATLPLVVFLFLCLAAPFFSRFSFFLPVVSKGSNQFPEVTLTFDDGPDPEITPMILELLKKHNARAIFFVVGKKVESNPQLIKQILSEGHEVGNHTYGHDPFIMLKSSKKLFKEIKMTNEILQKFGIRPVAFRPPVGITNPRLWGALLKSGMFCVNFSCRAYDMGNRYISKLSTRILNKVKPGDIILLHDVKPVKKSKSEYLIDEIEKIIIGLKEKDLNIVPLSQLIKKSVVIFDDREPGPVKSFYNSLASDYDNEQESAGVSPARKSEIALFNKNFLPTINGSHIVLELGAGTGRFTVPISQKSKEIYALDISENMIEVLNRKITNKKIKNIIPCVHDFLTLKHIEKFDIFCSFSSLEYIPDISEIFDKVYNLLKPGGSIYFITSSRSIFRFFVQIGNAMRQGIWLHARGKREIIKKLEKSGFSEIKVSTHGLKFLCFGGILMEVRARK